MKLGTTGNLALSLALCVLAACSGDDAPPASSVQPPAVQAPGAPPSEPAPAPSPSPVPSAAPEAATPPATPEAAAPSTPEPAAAPAPASPTPPAPVNEAAAATDTASAAPGYDVTCPPDAKAAEQCQVDKDTYIGWRTFAGQCQVCHGGSALGSTFAPNLLDRFHQRVDYPRFVDVVTHGYTGQVGAMPAWKGNPNVEPHIDRMYSYLKARADGALPPGRPARKP